MTSEAPPPLPAQDPRALAFDVAEAVERSMTSRFFLVPRGTVIVATAIFVAALLLTWFGSQRAAAETASERFAQLAADQEYLRAIEQIHGDEASIGALLEAAQVTAAGVKDAQSSVREELERLRIAILDIQDIDRVIRTAEETAALIRSISPATLGGVTYTWNKGDSVALPDGSIIRTSTECTIDMDDWSGIWSPSGGSLAKINGGDWSISSEFTLTAGTNYYVDGQDIIEGKGVRRAAWTRLEVIDAPEQGVEITVWIH